MASDDVQCVWLKTSEEITVRVECERCENLRWPAVNPKRYVQRALKRLDEGNEAEAREYLDDAVEALSYWCQHADEAGVAFAVEIEDSGEVASG